MSAGFFRSYLLTIFVCWSRYLQHLELAITATFSALSLSSPVLEPPASSMSLSVALFTSIIELRNNHRRKTRFTIAAINRYIMLLAKSKFALMLPRRLVPIDVTIISATCTIATLRNKATTNIIGLITRLIPAPTIDLLTCLNSPPKMTQPHAITPDTAHAISVNDTRPAIANVNNRLGSK